MTKLFVALFIVGAVAWAPAMVAVGPWAGCVVLSLSLISLTLAGKLA
jgi:hypothetical protein